MTRNLALAKVLQKYGDVLPIKTIYTIKDALKLYGEDDISDTDLNIIWNEVKAK